MTTQDCNSKLDNVKDLEDFQNAFFSENENGEMEPDFIIEYKTGENTFTDNEAAKLYDSNGSCTNSYIKCSDGHVIYPF
jgi:hypothetical protein